MNKLLTTMAFGALLCLLPANANPPRPVARFTGGPTHGQAPLLVNFTNQTTGQLTKETLSYGDGTSQIGPWSFTSHKYNTAGNYVATLNVSGRSGSSIAEFAVVVTNPPPPRLDAVTLAWTASTATNVDDYRLYWWGAMPGKTNVIDVGSVVQCVVTNIVPGATNTFGVTAIDTEGLESPLSATITYVGQ